MSDVLKSIAVEGGRMSVPVGIVLLAGWLYLDSRFDTLEEAQLTLACFHLKSAEARELAGCP